MDAAEQYALTDFDANHHTNKSHTNRHTNEKPYSNTNHNTRKREWVMYD